MYIRIVSARKHKTITFINGYSNILGNMQYMIDNELYHDMKCGDLIDCDIIDGLNNKDQPIKKIIKINKVIPCINFPSIKGINNDLTDEREKDYLSARNCGRQLQLLEYKKELIKNIRILLDGLNYFDASGLLNTVENYANGSNIADAIIKDKKENEPRYLRVTLENQLKQMTATLLKSTYSIDKVFRNMGEDNSHINEFLMLELVSLSNDVNEMLNFIKKIDLLAKELGEMYKIYVPDKKLTIIDYKELSKSSTNYDDIRKSFENTVVINFPCESPFIAKCEEDKIRKEIRWYVNGHWIAHYYKDENDLNNVAEVLKMQQLNNEKKDINPMHYFEWGLPSTISLGLSIDRWLQMLLDIKNINSVANPIALDYQNKTRRI